MTGSTSPDRIAGGFVNLKVHRDPATVAREVAELLAAEDLDWLAVCEAWQYAHHLALIPGYEYLTSRGKGPGGRDAGHLVRHGIRHDRYGLARTRVTWPRAKGPGQHWARDFPHLRLAGWLRVAAVHWPRNQPANAAAVAACWARLALLLRPGRGPYAAPGDYNIAPARRGLFTPRTLARVLRGRIIGRRIDHLHYRGCRVTDYRRGPGRTIDSDHEPILFTLEKKK